MSEQPAPPVLLREIADALVMSAAETICRGQEATPVVALLRASEQPPYGQTRLLEIELGADEAQRERLARALRRAAHEFGATGTVLLSEVWGAPEHRRGERYQFGEIPALPDRVERLMVMLGTAEGHWMGLAPITGTGLDRRCGALVYRFDEGRGRFANLIATPAQVAARNDALARFEAALRAAGLDPELATDGVKPLQHLHDVLVQNPAVTVDASKIAALVLAVRVLQQAWAAS